MGEHVFVVLDSVSYA
ncbi:Protein of unknown function [Anaplasma phagocytophilum]|uniref:Uncharacterized protein n=2 Tax=Anaplasma phagocytophilum TaxID=948 RepID=A0A098GJC3_ANAPH|nr:Protein of unknown function [Anaplasma phagocytophilum]